MSSLELLKKVLSNQKKEEVKKGNYKELYFEEYKENEGIKLDIPELEIIISFNKEGELRGASNYKW